MVRRIAALCGAVCFLWACMASEDITRDRQALSICPAIKVSEETAERYYRHAVDAHQLEYQWDTMSFAERKPWIEAVNRFVYGDQADLEPLEP